MSFLLGLCEVECVGFKTTPAVLMALFSGRLGSRGLTILHFRDEYEQEVLEAGSSNSNFTSDFDLSATLPTVSISCRSNDDILDGVHGLASGRSVVVRPHAARDGANPRVRLHEQVCRLRRLACTREAGPPLRQQVARRRPGPRTGG
jgi:hypothetical protein